ncbi:MAG: carbon storage regulator [Planctomycetota bacterium]
MLVLSRRVDEKIFFPALGISLKVVRIKGNTVRLGIDAPPEIRVVREEVSRGGELIEQASASRDVPAATAQWPDPVRENVACETANVELPASAVHGHQDPNRERTAGHQRCDSEQQELQSRLNSANLAIHFAQMKLREGLTEEAWLALDDTVRCLESLEAAIGMAAELNPPASNHEFLASVRERAGDYSVEKKTVLIVGETDKASGSLACFLKAEGYGVTSVESSSTAISYLANNRIPDVVFCFGSESEFTARQIRIADAGLSEPSTATIQFADESIKGWFADEIVESRILRTLSIAG